MAEHSMFFDSAVSDPRKYTSADFSEFFSLFYSNGVMMATNSDGLKVTAVQNALSVSVASGAAMINGHAYINDAPLTIALSAAHAHYARIDRIVLRLDLSLGERSIKAAVVAGTASATPSAPALTRTGTIYELSLAQVRVNANAVTIQSVTDERGDAAVCGISEGLYTLDLSEAQAEIEQLIEDLRDAGYVKQSDYELDVDQPVTTTSSPTGSSAQQASAWHSKPYLAHSPKEKH